ncbi:MAG: cysteine desulfurase NifS, partial [Sulfuricurvum sp. RIFCSPLOWO2_02_43_6]
SGATESLNFLLRGMGSSGHILSTSIEHAAVLNTLESLEKSGQKITYLPVDAWGAPRPEAILHEIRPDTKAIVLSLANAETGVKIDLKAIHQIAYERRIPLLIDAVALIGKEPFQLLPAIQAVAISAHKFHGPKGIGGLYVKKGSELPNLLHGGEQMGGKRAGTLNVAYIIGMGLAMKQSVGHLDKMNSDVRALRDRLEDAISQLPDTIVVGDRARRTPNTILISLRGIEGESMLWDLNRAGIAASTGSACASESLEANPVMSAIGEDPELAHTAIRLSLSRFTTADEIDYTIDVFVKAAERLRSISSTYAYTNEKMAG